MLATTPLVHDWFSCFHLPILLCRSSYHHCLHTTNISLPPILPYHQYCHTTKILTPPLSSYHQYRHTINILMSPILAYFQYSQHSSTIQIYRPSGRIFSSPLPGTPPPDHTSYLSFLSTYTIFLAQFFST